MKVLGHQIKDGKIMQPPERISKIADMQEPKNKKTLMSALGVFNYLMGHIPKLAELTAPLTDHLTHTDAHQWFWTHTLTAAFDKLKHACTNCIQLQPMNMESYQTGETKIYLVTDASQIGVGSYICQGQDFEKAQTHIIRMHSRKFTSAQANYTTTQQELLAIYDALKSFEPYLFGIQFTIRTDHKALETIQNNRPRSKREFRWMTWIGYFQFEIEHVPGKHNVFADYLSRIYEDTTQENTPYNEYVAEDYEDQKDAIKEGQYPHSLALYQQRRARNQRLKPKVFSVPWASDLSSIISSLNPVERLKSENETDAISRSAKRIQASLKDQNTVTHSGQLSTKNTLLSNTPASLSTLERLQHLNKTKSTNHPPTLIRQVTARPGAKIITTNATMHRPNGRSVYIPAPGTSPNAFSNKPHHHQRKYATGEPFSTSGN
jgi:hypothetical protein